MKKIVSFLFYVAVVMLCLSAETVIEVYEETDEWGDKTGESYIAIISDDFTFSNSYTRNEKGHFFALYMFPDYKMVVGAAVPYSWSSNVSTFYIDDEIIVKYRDGNKGVTEVKTKPEYNKLATFTLLTSSSEELIRTMKNTDKLQLIVKGTDYESTDQYYVTFEYDCQELVTCLEKVGWITN